MGGRGLGATAFELGIAGPLLLFLAAACLPASRQRHLARRLVGQTLVGVLAILLVLLTLAPVGVLPISAAQVARTVWGAFVEEFTFRVALMTQIREVFPVSREGNGGTAAAATLSQLAFGMSHLATGHSVTHEIFRLAGFTAGGAVLLLVLVTVGFWAALATHALFNLNSLWWPPHHGVKAGDWVISAGVRVATRDARLQAAAELLGFEFVDTH